MRFFVITIMVVLLYACAPGQYGPLLINPQDEILFQRGLADWQEGHAAPLAFERLLEQYPDSPLALAVDALRQCREEEQSAQLRIDELLAERQSLQHNLAERTRELETLRNHNRKLTEQIAELETSLELSKQILLETEAR